MEQLKAFWENVMAYVGQMTASQVMLLFGITAGSIVGIVFMVGWLSSVTYVRLYSNLSEQASGEIITYLNDNKIPFTISQSGHAIDVPSDKVYQTRISLASEGLPNAGYLGYSIFDQNQLGMTDFLQNLNFRSALEGELTRTIIQLDEVSAARVHLVMPKDRLFKKDQNQTTASVILKLKGSSGLTGMQINGITHLVASSVEGLTPDKITIVDYNGNLLSSGQQHDPLAGLSSSQLQVRKNVEQYLEDKAESMLATVLGAGKAVVRITVDLNFQQVERTVETYDPNTPSIRSEEKTRATNSSVDKQEETAENEEESSTETTITNYELNKTVEHIVNAVGTVDRLSIAVMIDGIYLPAEEEGGEPIYQPRGQEELDRLSSIVRNAVGFDQQRSDQIEMFNISFDHGSLQVDQTALDSMYMREFIMEIAQKVGTVLLFVFLFFFVKKRVKKFFEVLGKFTIPSQPLTVASTASAQASPIRQAPEVQPIVAEKREPTLIDQMQETAKGEPEEIAKVIKTIMVD